MAFTVTGLRTPMGDPVYYDANFRAVIEDHRIQLINGEGATIKLLPEGETLRWRYDFYGLLTSLSIPRELHWIILRVNDMVSPTDFDVGMTTLIIPNNKTIDRMLAVYNTIAAN